MLLSGTHLLGLGRAQQYYQLSRCKAYREATKLFWLSFVFPPTTPNFLHSGCMHYSSCLHLEPDVIAQAGLTQTSPFAWHGRGRVLIVFPPPPKQQGRNPSGGIRPHPLGGVTNPPVVVQASRAPAKLRECGTSDPTWRPS